jgi:hypothetical protein
MGNPFVKAVTPKVYPGDRHQVVVLDRIEPGELPPYCVHGRATCINCDEWVWLGDKTHDLVAEQGVAPLCRECANRIIPRGEGVEPIGNAGDTLRGQPHG